MKRLFAEVGDTDDYVVSMLNILQNGEESADEFVLRVKGLSEMLIDLEEKIPPVILNTFCDFFQQFLVFCFHCYEIDFLIENVDMLATSLGLLDECLEELEKQCREKVKQCACCVSQVIYNPLPRFYQEMKIKYGNIIKSRSETLNAEEYLCPKCISSDRDRLIVSYLKKIKLPDAGENIRVLQIAPAAAIHKWLIECCPQIGYDTSDLFMPGVTFTSDIQDLKEINDESYDIVICSHVLEHVQDDEKAMRAMKRVLKKDGQIIFLVPIDLNRKEIDEEWGCSESENWRRFGQGDHCRAYSKSGLVERLKKYFLVNQLGKDYFGDEVFFDCGLTETSTLYVLTKGEVTV